LAYLEHDDPFRSQRVAAHSEIAIIGKLARRQGNVNQRNPAIHAEHNSLMISLAAVLAGLHLSEPLLNCSALF
jgi:hypothetical protein